MVRLKRNYNGMILLTVPPTSFKASKLTNCVIRDFRSSRGSSCKGKACARVLLCV